VDLKINVSKERLHLQSRSC